MTSTLDSYTVGRTLGSGFSAVVKVGTNPAGEEFALKIFRRDNAKFDARAFELLKREVEATTSLDHKHVVKYFEFNESATWHKKSGKTVEVAYIVQEMIPGGEFFDYVANSGPFSESMCRYYFKQMLLGINYIHGRGFSHRDLKPENILLDKNYNVKIVDFGFACSLEGRDGSGMNNTQVGTPGYMAPEILSKEPYHATQCDIFALGVILFILYSGHPPFGLANDQDNFYKLVSTLKTDLFWKAHSNPNRKAAGFYTEDFQDFITTLVQKDPCHRPCIADIVGHPWMAGEYPTEEEVRIEFARRDQVNKDRSNEERERKEAKKNNESNAPRRDVVLNGKVYLSHDAEANEACPEIVVRPALKDYSGVNHTYTVFSTFPPEYLLEQLIKNLNCQQQDFECSDKTWKVNFNVRRQLNTEAVEVAQEEGIQVPGIYEEAGVQVDIKKVPNQQKYCLDFSRKTGSAILFYDNANKFVDLLELVNNTTLDHDETSTGIVTDEPVQQQAAVAQ